MAKGKKEASQPKPERKTPSLTEFLTALKKHITKTEMNGNTKEHHVDYTELHKELAGKGFTATRGSVVQRIAKYNKRLQTNNKKYKFVAHRKNNRKVSEQQFLATMDSMFDSDDK